MKIEIFKTYEITNDYWNQIIIGFNESFQGHHITEEQLKIAAVSNYFGYSYHAICTTEDKQIIGFNSIAPNYYIHNNAEKVKVGLSGSTFVLKEYRKDIFIFHDMYMALKEYCKKDGIIVFLGVPNMNSYQYSIKFLKCKEVFALPYYVFPKNIFSVIENGKYSYLNIFSKFITLLSLLFAYLISFFVNSKEQMAKYRIFQDELYLTNRFQNKKYKTICNDNLRFTYVCSEEKNLKTIYLMYFSEKGERSFRSLVKAILYIFSHEKFDMIMYIGTMNLNQFLLFRVPRRFEPKKLPFTYNLLDIDNKSDYADMGIDKNWDFSLMNLDVR